MQDQLEIVLKQEDSDARVTTVRALDPINVLFSPSTRNSQAFPLVLLNNHDVLSPSFSFKFYHIKNGDEIHLIPQKKREQQKISEESNHFHNSYFPSLYQLHEHTNQLFQLYGQRPDQESMQQVVEELADPKTAIESARLRDQYYNKIEGSVTSHRRLLKRYMNLSNSCEIAKDRRFQLTRQTSADAPSTSALPCMWKRGRKKAGDDHFL